MPLSIRTAFNRSGTAQSCIGCEFRCFLFPAAKLEQVTGHGSFAAQRLRQRTGLMAHVTTQSGVGLVPVSRTAIIQRSFQALTSFAVTDCWLA